MDCNPGIPNPRIPDRLLIPKSRHCARPNPGISGLEFSVMSCAEKHALLIKYKLYVNAVVAELAGLKAALIPIVCTTGCPGSSETQDSDVSAITQSKPYVSYEHIMCLKLESTF